MTISVPNQLVYSSNGDGATSQFSYPVRILEASELVVIRSEGGVDTTLTLNTDYTLSGIGDAGGVTITMLSVPTVGQEITRYRATAPKQIVDLKDKQTNPAEAVEQQLDRLAMVGQDHDQRISEYEDRIDDLDTSVAAAAASATAAGTSETNAAASATAAAGSANAASTSADAAAASAAEAGATLAGATMNTDTDVSANSWVLDEDDMASDSAAKVPTQQSVKAYVDALGFSAPVADTFLRAKADATGYDALTAAQAWSALADENVFDQAKSDPAKFWSNVHPGAKIHRMNDRVLIGAATDNSGETPATASEDWLETLRTSTTKNSQLAVLSTIGQTAIIGGSRTSDFHQAGSQGCIAGSFWALNDNTVEVQSAYAAYLEAHREAGAGTTHGFELDTVNFGDLVTIHPYLMFSTGLTSGGWLAAGGGTAWPGAGDCSAAVAILANSASARWEKGIVFHAAGLVGTDGDGTGSAVAIEMARGHVVRWLFTGGIQGASISSNVSNTAATQQIQFSDLGTLFRNAAGKNMFQIGIGSAVVNGVKVTPANTGVGPVVGAIGDDANIDLGLAPKGTGLVRLTGQDSVLATTASAFSATRYVKIKDDAGNVLYVPCTGSAW